MNARTTAVIAVSVVVVVGGAALAHSLWVHRKMPPKPMPTGELASVAAAMNYSFMSADFQAGRAAVFAKNYADSADLAATGFGSIRGRAAIANEFAGEGVRLKVSQFVRQSHGASVNGRTARDSGEYELVGATASRQPGDIDPKGKFWTVWQYSDIGEWTIVADTLIGTGRTRADLAPRHK